MERKLVAIALAITLLVGLWLRLGLASVVSLAHFPFLRHAHSHMGYYGVLFPLAWFAWYQAGIKTIHSSLYKIYALATTAAFIGFVRSGYGVTAIAASTIIAVIWLIAAYPTTKRIKKLQDPLGGVFFGIILAETCTPFVAIFLDSDPALAYNFVGTFLSLLLLLVVIPSALSLHKVKIFWPLFLVSGTLGSLFFGLWNHEISRLGLFIYATMLGWGVKNSLFKIHLRIIWMLLVVSFWALASGTLPLLPVTIIAGVHFIILGPVIASLADSWFKRPLPSLMWYFGYTTVGIMSGALVAQGLEIAGPTSLIAAIGGALIVLWWTTVLLFQLAKFRPKNS